jgi:hypothetical protein
MWRWPSCSPRRRRGKRRTRARARHLTPLLRHLMPLHTSLSPPQSTTHTLPHRQPSHASTPLLCRLTLRALPYRFLALLQARQPAMGGAAARRAAGRLHRAAIHRPPLLRRGDRGHEFRHIGNQARAGRSRHAAAPASIRAAALSAVATSSTASIATTCTPGSAWSERFM